jgi:alpha-tubulin suppressor-like RCC1 family protein
VLPSAEVCSGEAVVDEDCDGAADEGGVCAEYVLTATGGIDHTCALLHGGRVKCWGFNDDGQLGLGDKVTRGDEPNEMGAALPFVDLGAGEEAKAIASGRQHTCALLQGGRVKCWGWNALSQLGLGDLENRGDNPGEMGDNLPVIDLGAGVMASAIVVGDLYACALLGGGKVKCWGNNGSGQLGLGNTENRGDAPGEMGDSLPYVNLGTGETAVALTAGYVHTCALLDDGDVKCWGHNHRGQLGLGDTQNRGNQAGQMGDSLPIVDLGQGVKAEAIFAASFHTCARLIGGESLKCWGFNADGHLGIGTVETMGDGPNEMGDNLPVVSFGGGKKVVTMAGGDGHICASLDDGSVRCWGWNGLGQLGLGDTMDRGNTPASTPEKLPPVSLGLEITADSITSGEHASCAVLSGGSLKCWGSNNRGELGLGDTNTRGDGPNEMGDNLPFVPVF